jgi:hypothetical protein
MYINPDPPAIFTVHDLGYWIYQTRISLVINHGLLVLVNLLKNSLSTKYTTFKHAVLFVNMMTYIWVIISTGAMVY